MSFNYVNLFNKSSATGETSSPASIDFDPLGNPNALGNMKFGGNGQAQDTNPFVPDPSGRGLIVRVTNTAAALPASRTFYVVSGASENPARGRFSESKNLTAQLYFDSPHCTDTTTWGVGLNFKTGNENDAPEDQILFMGPTCQFKSHGLVNFHGTEFDSNPVLADGTYHAYAMSGTTFKLWLSLRRTAASVEAEALLVVQNKFTANLNATKKGRIDSRGTTLDAAMTPLPLQNLPTAFSNPNQITAIGVAVVNFVAGSTKTAPSTVSVRLLDFGLSYT